MTRSEVRFLDRPLMTFAGVTDLSCTNSNIMEIKELQKNILDLAGNKKIGTKPKDINFGEKIALIHAEISEVLEAYRRSQFGGKDGLAEELADVIIRIFHLAGIYNIDLEKEILAKMELNKNRDWSKDNLNKDKK